MGRFNNLRPSIYCEATIYGVVPYGNMNKPKLSGRYEDDTNSLFVRYTQVDKAQLLMSSCSPSSNLNPTSTTVALATFLWAGTKHPTE